MSSSGSHAPRSSTRKAPQSTGFFRRSLQAALFAAPVLGAVAGEHLYSCHSSPHSEKMSFAGERTVLDVRQRISMVDALRYDFCGKNGPLWMKKSLFDSDNSVLSPCLMIGLPNLKERVAERFVAGRFEGMEVDPTKQLSRQGDWSDFLNRSVLVRLSVPTEDFMSRIDDRIPHFAESAPIEWKKEKVDSGDLSAFQGDFEEESMQEELGVAGIDWLSGSKYFGMPSQMLKTMYRHTPHGHVLKPGVNAKTIDQHYGKFNDPEVLRVRALLIDRATDSLKEAYPQEDGSMVVLSGSGFSSVVTQSYRQTTSALSSASAKGALGSIQK